LPSSLFPNLNLTENSKAESFRVADPGFKSRPEHRFLFLEQ
jgi:hypothetical protein